MHDLRIERVAVGAQRYIQAISFLRAVRLRAMTAQHGASGGHGIPSLNADLHDRVGDNTTDSSCQCITKGAERGHVFSVLRKGEKQTSRIRSG